MYIDDIININIVCVSEVKYKCNIKLYKVLSDIVITAFAISSIKKLAFILKY